MIIRSTQVLQRPLFCNSSLFYMLLYHFTLYLLELKYFTCKLSLKVDLSLTIQLHCVSSVTLPDSVTIFGTRINVHVNEVCHGELRNLTESRICLDTLILRNDTVDFKLLYSLYLSTK